jgi:hypothetical protein
MGKETTKSRGLEKLGEKRKKPETKSEMLRVLGLTHVILGSTVLRKESIGYFSGSVKVHPFTSHLYFIARPQQRGRSPPDWLDWLHPPQGANKFPQ